MSEPSDDLALAWECARAIRDGFAGYNEAFREITRRARRRFENRDWVAGQRDAVERIELYDGWVRRLMDSLRARLGPRVRDRELWKRIKVEFQPLIVDYVDREFTKTYFSSITRRLFGTEGIDPEVEFVAIDEHPLEGIERPVPLVTYHMDEPPLKVFRRVLADLPFDAPWEHLEHSLRFLTGEFGRHWRPLGGVGRVRRLEFLRPVFYQNTRAYLVGRAVDEKGAFEPLVIALRSERPGIAVDAVITHRSDVSVLFGFTRSYFHADLETVHDAVNFLRTLIPKKPVAEIFTVLGRAKQGKTERYRSFTRHMLHSMDRLVEAPGDKGMVMVVFHLPSYDLVFKVIRDHFAYPKTVDRRDVLEKYELVFKHDRAGRLVDAQEFKLWRFPQHRFDQDLLEELLTRAAETCRLDGGDVVVEHLYIERRMTPLNLFLRNAPAEDARLAILDYGQAIRDLAATNIFPGDLLLKNFGVTRNGRVIFYDYDELCLVTECNFRDLPKARSMEEEMQAEAWFYVGENDVFPEQFVQFLGLKPHYMEIFLDAHEELVTASYWRDMKERHLAGEVVEVLPYRRSLMAPPTPARPVPASR